MANRQRSNPPIRISKRSVDAAKPREVQYILWDSEIPGFGVKVLPTGRKTYLLKYRTQSGQIRKPSIGVHGALTADQARVIAQDWSAGVRLGEDPSLKKQEERPMGRPRHGRSDCQVAKIDF